MCVLMSGKIWSKASHFYSLVHTRDVLLIHYFVVLKCFTNCYSSSYMITCVICMSQVIC